MFSRTAFVLRLLVFLVAGASSLSAVILFSTGDPSQNTAAPTGKLAGSGWQYTGAFGSFSATAIDPNHFISVKHLGVPSNVFAFRGLNYPIVQWFDSPSTDLRIFELSGTLPTWAPLYTKTNEAGLGLVVIGRGTQRGDAVYNGGILRGWLWGGSDGVQRWGQNQVARASGSDLYATFDQNGKPMEAHISVGDSGGGVFIKDGGAWKLAGVSDLVDRGVSTTPGGPVFDAALFDGRGFYGSNGQLISGAHAVPSGFYAVRISSDMSWIRTIISPAASPPPSNAAQMTSPAPGTTLPSSMVTFNWTAGGASTYKLFVGNSVGGSDIYNSGKLTVRSLSVGNIPTNGAMIHVRLWSKVGKKWLFIDYSYKAYG